MSVREEVKSLLAKEAMTMNILAKEMTLRTGKQYSMKSISDKLARKTLRYEEFITILDILGYSIEYKKKI